MTSDLLDTSLNAKEWAIQNAMTKSYRAPRFPTYAAAARHIATFPGPEFERIVPAPPREMTNEECWTWYRLGRVGTPLCLSGSASGFCVWRPNWNAGYYEDPCDAIRAARRKVEAE